MEQQATRYRRMPKGERRVRFADTVGLDLVSIFLIDFISNYYFSIHTHKFSLPHKPHNPIISDKPHNTSSDNNHYRSNNNNNNTSNHNHNSSISSNLGGYDVKAAIKSSSTTNASLANNNNNHYSNSNSISNTNNGARSKHPPAITPEPPRPTYECEFTQPISLVSFRERVKLNKVNLETCRVGTGAGNVSVSCTIRVLNLSYNKSVIVRYTTDEWHTHTDCLASYVPGSCDGWSDKFTSTFSVSSQVKSFQAGQRIIFAIKYAYDGDNIHWDNNGGLNYTVKKV